VLRAKRLLTFTCPKPAAASNGGPKPAKMAIGSSLEELNSWTLRGEVGSGCDVSCSKVVVAGSDRAGDRVSKESRYAKSAGSLNEECWKKIRNRVLKV